MKNKLKLLLIALFVVTSLHAQTDSLSLVKKRNVECIAASTFIPGLGQMLKGHYTEGSLFLFSEVALCGAAAFPMILSREQLKIINDPNSNYSAFVNAKKTYTNQRIVAYSLFGAAAVLHITNMVRAYTLQDKKVQYAVYPTAIVTEGDLAYGMSLTVKF